MTAGSQGCTVLFRYGVVVLFGLSAVGEVTFLSGLKPLVIEPLERAEWYIVILIVVEVVLSLYEKVAGWAHRRRDAGSMVARRTVLVAGC